MVGDVAEEWTLEESSWNDRYVEADWVECSFVGSSCSACYNCRILCSLCVMSLEFDNCLHMSLLGYNLY